MPENEEQHDEKPTATRKIVTVIAITAIGASLFFVLNKKEPEPQFPDTPVVTEDPQEEPTSEPEPTVTEDPNTKKAVEAESTATDVRVFDEDSLIKAGEEKVGGAEEAAIEAVENYYAYSTNETSQQRTERLKKFFLPGSPYLTSTPSGPTQEAGTIPDDGRYDMGGKVGVSMILNYQDGQVAHMSFVAIQVRVDELSPDDNQSWVFRYDAEVQTVLEKVDGQWKVISILENKEVAR